MADKLWIGNDDASVAANYSPSGVPINGDNLDFSPEYNGSMTTGLTALAGVTLARIWWMEGNRSNVGGPGIGLAHSASKFVFQGDGKVYSNNTATSHYFLNGSANSLVTFTTAIQGTMGTFSGNVYIADPSGLLSSFVVGSKIGAPQPVVTIKGVNQLFASRSNVSGGTIYTESPLNTTTVDGGRIYYLPTGTAQWLGDIYIAGGTLQWDATLGGAVGSKIYISSGLLDMTHDRRSKTLPIVVVGPAGDFQTHSAITVTTLTDYRPDFPVLP